MLALVYRKGYTKSMERPALLRGVRSSRGTSGPAGCLSAVGRTAFEEDQLRVTFDLTETQAQRLTELLSGECSSAKAERLGEAIASVAQRELRQRLQVEARSQTEARASAGRAPSPGSLTRSRVPDEAYRG